jgi:hypothetical protein
MSWVVSDAVTVGPGQTVRFFVLINAGQSVNTQIMSTDPITDDCPLVVTEQIRFSRLNDLGNNAEFVYGATIRNEGQVTAWFRLQGGGVT